MMSEVRGPFMRRQNGTIDCEVHHPDFGWIPFTAGADDPEPSGRQVHATIEANHAGEIAPPQG